MNLGTQKDINIYLTGNFTNSSWSSGMEQRQVNQGYREALFQISPTVEKKKGKRKPGALERVVGEKERKKEKESGGKRKRNDRNRNPLSLTQ